MLKHMPQLNFNGFSWNVTKASCSANTLVVELERLTCESASSCSVLDAVISFNSFSCRCCVNCVML